MSLTLDMAINANREAKRLSDLTNIAEALLGIEAQRIQLDEYETNLRTLAKTIESGIEVPVQAIKAAYNAAQYTR